MATSALTTACSPPCAIFSSSRTALCPSRPRLASLYSSGLQTCRLATISQGRQATPGKAFAIAVTEKDLELSTLPTWTDFEIGRASVFWETATGEAPIAGGQLTIYFNPTASSIEATTDYGIGFNGGFNQPIMCGGEPRIMTRKARGNEDEDLFSIKINVPQHALTLEFSFTDGTSWDGPYKIKFQVPAKWRNQPKKFFDEGLAAALSADGACAEAIFPEPVFVQDRCMFPGNLTIEGGNRCDLDLEAGCMDRENPFYNPLANVEDSCPYISDSDTES